jgi:DNA-nicking Smr family endonuclease
MSKSSEKDLFEQAMAGVEPLADRRRALPARRPSRPGSRAARSGTELAGGSSEFRVERIGERVEGLGRGADPRLATRLKGGEYPPDDRRDLHGMTRREARQAVDDLLARARERGHRSVLVIHGRGKGSSGGPVLKEAVIEWLSSPPWSKRIAAFASAPPALGGAGATLVLLRR